jgi:hypothetical protein
LIEVYGSKYKADFESVKNYQAPKPEETAAVRAASKLPPDVQLLYK